MGERRTARAAGIDVPTLCFAVAGIAAAAALPFVRVRPNRIADGVSRLLAEVDPAAAAVLLALWGIAGIAAIVRMAEGVRAKLATLVSVGAPICVIVAAGIVTGRIAGTAPIIRVSLSAGFWATAILGYASFFAASRKIALEEGLIRRVLGFSVPVLIGALLFSGFLDAVSVMREWAVQKTVFLAETTTHLILAGSAVLAG